MLAAMKATLPPFALLALLLATLSAPAATLSTLKSQISNSDPSPSSSPASSSPVYVIPIRGQIEGALLYVIRRGLAEAQQQNAAAILLVMDTPGGTLAAAGDIVASIQTSPVPVYTFVENHAFSAGAIIALATKAIYMAPGSVIGDALPILVSPIGGIQEMSPGIEEKSVSGTAALIRSAAQAAGHDPELAEKMVRRETEYKLGDTLISPAGQLLTLTAAEAARPRPDGTPLLSAGTAPDLPAVLRQLALHHHPLVEMRITSTEKIARLIAGAAPILMMLGFLGIYIEIKTPGFGLPGILGAACLALFFWGHHIAGLAGMEDLLLFVAGIALVLVEIFLIPGFGFTGIFGLALVLVSLIGAMTRLAPAAPWLPAWDSLQTPIFNTAIALLGTGALVLLLARLLPNSPLYNRLALSATTAASQGYTAAPDTSSLVGQTGTALTPLHPAGAARIGTQRLDVVTSGEYLDPGTPIRIIQARGNHILVQKS